MEIKLRKVVCICGVEFVVRVKGLIVLFMWGVYGFLLLNVVSGSSR